MSRLADARYCTLLILFPPDLSLFSSFPAKILIAYARLNEAGSVKSAELVQIIGEGGEHNLDMNPSGCGYKHRASLKTDLIMFRLRSKLPLM